MAKYMLSRMTYWNVSGGQNPNKYGDYRFYWELYYETDKANKRTKITVYYYRQTHSQEYVEGLTPTAIPNGTATAYINDESLGSISHDIIFGLFYGDNEKLTYIGKGSKYIYHNDDGSASFEFRASSKFGGNNWGVSEKTYSTPTNFPTIPAPSLMGTINNFTIDTGVSIPITKYVSSYYDVLEISNGSNVLKTIENITNGFVTKTSTPVSVTFTEDELNNIYSKIPKGESAVFTLKLFTYSNSNKTSQIGSTGVKTVTGNFVIQLPSVYGGICTDAIANNSELTGDTTNQTIIKGQSLIHISIPANMQAIANTRKATIVEYVVDDIHIPYSANGISESLSTSNSNKDHVTIYAVDSRGTSSLPYTQKFTKYVDYNRITLDTKNYKFERQDNGVSRLVDTSFEGTWFNGNFGVKQNTLTPFVFYRVNNGKIWNDLNEFIDGASVGRLDMSKLDISTNGVFKYNGPIMSAESDTGFDIKNSYDIFFGLMDELTNEGFTLSINYGEPAGAIYKNKMALGGPYDEQLGGTQLWGDVYMNGQPLSTSASGGTPESVVFPIGYIYMSVIQTNPNVFFGGTWEQLKDVFLLAAGDTYTAGSTGGEAEVRLTVDTMPTHSHSGWWRQVGATGSQEYVAGLSDSYEGVAGARVTSDMGGNQAHNNMPPYLTVYMWKRVA